MLRIRSIAESLIGKRENNEDAFYPKIATEDSRIFIVCDGVGGSNKGEIASGITAEIAGSQLQDGLQINAAAIKKALMLSVAEIRNHIHLHPENEGMASTVVLAVFNETNLQVAWCGDSRFYHIRDGKILFQTKDHSLVQQLVNEGLISEEQAQTHPRKNIILHSIATQTKESYIEFSEINDVKPGDFFLLCTDGLLEVLTNDFIKEQFIHTNSLQHIQAQLNILASGNTNDNCTWYLLQS